MTTIIPPPAGTHVAGRREDGILKLQCLHLRPRLMTNSFLPTVHPNEHRAARVSPTILQLEKTLEQLRQQEMQRFQKKLSAPEADRLTELTRALMRRYLQLPMGQLSAARQRGDAAPVLAMLTELFALETLPGAA